MVTNSKNWVVDSGATRHICANKDAFAYYTPIGDEEKVVYLGDSHTTQVPGKRQSHAEDYSGKDFGFE